MPSPPMSGEERAWVHECFLAGDSIDEIAATAGRPRADIVGVVGSGRSLSDTEREILSLYASGCTFPEIDRERGGAYAKPGKAAAAAITKLRRRGLAIPYRYATMAHQLGVART